MSPLIDVAATQTDLADPDADGDEARTLRPLQAAAVTYRIAFGPRAGHKVLTLRSAIPRESVSRQPLCADIDGFSLHAAVRVEAHDRKRLEQLCRHITRPALSDERVQTNAAERSETCRLDGQARREAQLRGLQPLLGCFSRQQTQPGASAGPC